MAAMLLMNPPIASIKDGALLLGSIALLFLSIILLYESTILSRSNAVELEAARPSVLVQMLPSVLSSVTILALWMRFVSANQATFYDAPLWWLLRQQPRDFVPGCLIAATVPSVISVFRFLATFAQVRANPSPARTVSVFGVVIAIINLAGSIASVLTFFRP